MRKRRSASLRRVWHRLGSQKSLAVIGVSLGVISLLLAHRTELGGSRILTALVVMLTLFFAGILSFWAYRLARFGLETLVERFPRLERRYPVLATLAGNSNELVRYRIHDIVTQRLGEYGLDITGINFNERTTLTDVRLSLTRVSYYERIDEEIILREVVNARSFAFNIKYGRERDQDEKIIAEETFGSWISYLMNHCEKNGIEIVAGMQIVEVGFGTGKPYEGKNFIEPLIEGRGNFIGADISRNALRLAKGRFPRMKVVQSSAENLDGIMPDSMDLYMSFRTYSSSLFDLRRAIVEAKRVLRKGGDFVVSVPHLFMTERGPVWGLVRDVRDPTPTKKYRDEVIESIAACLEVHKFESISIGRSERDFPYEAFISGRRGV